MNFDKPVDLNLNKKESDLEKRSEREDVIIQDIHAELVSKKVALESLDSQTGDEKERLAQIRMQLEAFESESTEVEEVELDWAKIRIVYEQHDKEHHPRVAKGVDAYFFEGVNFFRDNLGIPNGRILEKFLTSGDADENIISFIEKNKIPAYYVDLNGPVAGEVFEDLKDYRTKEKMVNVILKSLLAYQTVKSLGNLSDAKMNRRNFLKLAGGASVVGVADYYSDTGMLNRESGSHRKRNEIEKARNDIIESFGLRNVAHTLRNAIWAQKLFTVSKDNKDEKGLPYFAIEVGAQHTGLENFLKLSEEARLEIIRIIIEEFKIDDLETQIGAVTKLTYTDEEGGGWVYENNIDNSIINTVRGDSAIVASGSSGSKAS
ncbi:hypothetical protein ACFL08_04215 [Patescibacteria group bacterium]